MDEETEFCLTYLGETAAAYKVERPDGREVWLPKSRVEMEDGGIVGREVNFLIPDWLAIEKGIA